VTTLSLVLQLAGIALALFGIAVGRAWLERAATAATEAKRGVARWVALRRDALARRWAQLVGRPRSVLIDVDPVVASVSVSGGTVTIGRGRPDRDAISERDWLALLDDQMEGVYQRLDSLHDLRSTDRRRAANQLAEQAKALRAEMLAATQQGWQLIVAGLLCSALGTTLGFWA
jgi:hypothetical protein